MDQPILALILLFQATLAQPICKDSDPKVLILGAGLSGVAVARTLYDKGIRDLVILEATAKVGGRIRSFEFAGVKVELGGTTIIGVDYTNSTRFNTNPIWALKTSTNLNGVYFNYSSYVVYNESGAVVTSDVQLASEQYNIAFDEASTTLQAQGNTADVSVRAGLNMSGWCPRNPPDNYVDWLKNDLAKGLGPEETSLREILEDTTHTDYGASSYLVADTRGSEYLVQYLGEPFLDTASLHLNTTVESIEYGAHCACVSAMQNGRAVRYCGKQAVLTFSVGVLQSDRLKFIPSLPQWKLDAIHQFMFPLELRIYILFNETFWDTSVSIIGHASTNRENYAVFLPIGNYFPSKPPLLLTFATGTLAQMVANQNKNVTKLEICAVLKSIYGNFRSELVDIFVPDIPYYNGYGLLGVLAPKVGTTSRPRTTTCLLPWAAFSSQVMQ